MHVGARIPTNHRHTTPNHRAMARRNHQRCGFEHDRRSNPKQPGTSKTPNPRPYTVQIMETQRVRRGKRHHIPNWKGKCKQTQKRSNKSRTGRSTTSNILSVTCITNGRPHRFPKNILESRRQILLAKYGNRHPDTHARMRTLQCGEHREP